MANLCSRLIICLLCTDMESAGGGWYYWNSGWNFDSTVTVTDCSCKYLHFHLHSTEISLKYFAIIRLCLGTLGQLGQLHCSLWFWDSDKDLDLLRWKWDSVQHKLPRFKLFITKLQHTFMWWVLLPLIITAQIFYIIIHYISMRYADWAAWGSWSSCSVSCGGGSKSRTRDCIDPATTSIVSVSYCSGGNGASTSCNVPACKDFKIIKLQKIQ